MGVSVEIRVRKPRKPLPEEVAKVCGPRSLGRGGKGGGLAEVDASEGFSGVAAQVGGGENLRVDLPQPEDHGQRLREVVRHRGGPGLRGDDEAHGEASGSCLRIIRQFLYELR